MPHLSTNVISRCVCQCLIMYADILSVMSVTYSVLAEPSLLVMPWKRPERSPPYVNHFSRGTCVHSTAKHPLISCKTGLIVILMT